MDTCKHCGAPIEWAVNAKRMRVAVERVRGGTLVLLPPIPKSGSLERRLVDAAAYGENLVRSITYRRHRESCTERTKRR